MVVGVRKRLSNFLSISGEHQFYIRLIFFLLLLMLLKCNKMQCIDICLRYHVWKVDIWRFLNKITAHLPISLFKVFKQLYLIIVSVFFEINHAPSKYSLLMYSELEILIAPLVFKQMSKQMCTRLKFPYVYVSHRIHRCVKRSLSAPVQGYHFATRIE